MINQVIIKSKAQLYSTIYPKTNCDSVIMLHGGPGIPDNLTHVAETLSANFQVITFHQRGTALSPCDNNYSMDSYLSDLDCIADYFNLNRFHLFGHSWGGLYAQIYAQAHPERIISLFLCSPGSGTGSQWRETEAEVFQFNKSKCNNIEFIGMGINSLFGKMGSDRSYQRLFRQVLKNYNKGYVVDEDVYDCLRYIKSEPINATRREIVKYPLLNIFENPEFAVVVSYGDADIYGGSRKYVEARYPSAIFREVKKSGHLSWLHNPIEFKKILNGHFDFFKHSK